MPNTPIVGRLIQECEELSELAASFDCIQEAAFSQNNAGLLSWSFKLVIDDRRIPLCLVFPALFPDLPPFVLPADETVRLSQHQYGEGGELCLQYRPDNWHPDCRSTDVVRSAKELLEATPAHDIISAVESDHPSDLPSLLRGYPLRFMLPSETARLLRIRVAGLAADLRLTMEHRIGSSNVDAALVARVVCIGPENNLSIPSDGPGFGGKAVQGVMYRLPGIHKIPEQLKEKVANQLYLLLPRWLRKWISKSEEMPVVLSNGEREVLLLVRHIRAKRQIEIFHTFEPPQAKERRSHGLIFRKYSVCIIGAGSLGSKVAACLAREGIGHFMLLDNDVLWSDNLVRNELDEMDVGHHKAVSLQHRLLRINPGAKVSAIRMSLTSQSTVQNIEKLGEIISSCDLVVETTADSGVFRMAAAICTKKRKPLVWACVYAGGIGGLVARSVPLEDPAPINAAAQLREWCAAKDTTPPDGLQREYGLQIDDQNQPIFASDGDVGVIANRLSRHALDALSLPEMRAHPEPAYYIGLRRGWIFDHPFDTHPVIYNSNDGWADESVGGRENAISKVMDQLGVSHDA